MAETAAPGRVFSVSVSSRRFHTLFPHAESPVLVFDFAVYLDCSIPREERIPVVVETATGEVLSARDSFLTELAGAVREGRLRVDADVYEGAVVVAGEYLEQKLPPLVAKCQEAVDEERRQRRRKLDTVFDLRLADARSVEGEEALAEVARLQEEKRRAVRHAEAHYDPESLNVLAEVELVLLVGAGHEA